MSSMVADCFEWVVKIMIFIVELMQHHYEYGSVAYSMGVSVETWLMDFKDWEQHHVTTLYPCWSQGSREMF